MAINYPAHIPRTMGTTTYWRAPGSARFESFTRDTGACTHDRYHHCTACTPDINPERLIVATDTEHTSTEDKAFDALTAAVDTYEEFIDNHRDPELADERYYNEKDRLSQEMTAAAMAFVREYRRR